MTESGPQAENKEKLNKRILLAVDEGAMLGLTTFFKSEGCAVVTANNGEEVLNKIRSGEVFDVLIADDTVGLSNRVAGDSVVKVVEHIRADEQLKGSRDLPVVVLSWDSGIDESVKKLGGKHIIKSSMVGEIQKKLKQTVGEFFE